MDWFEHVASAPAPTRPSGEEIASSISHGVGFVAALIGTPILLVAAFEHRKLGFFVGTIVFAFAMLSLYLGSTLYHAWPQTRTKAVLRVFDHCAIFLLIAATYTPFGLGPLTGPIGSAMLGVVWALALLGILLKTTLGPLRASKLAMTLYLGMGWFVILSIRPVILALPLSATLLLFAGGIAYTSGVLFFVNERLRYSHFVWHLFVLVGSTCHFLAVLACVT
jgi:hemolysin III